MNGSKVRRNAPRGLRNRYGQWHYRFKVSGHSYSGSTGLAATQPNVNDALRVRADERSRILNGSPKKPELYPFSKAAGEFLEWCDGEYAAHPNSAGRIRTSFASLQIFFDKEPVRNIRAGQIEDYKTFRRKQRIKEITLRHDLHALSVFFQYANKKNWCGDNPIEDVEIPSDKGAERMYVLTPEEEERWFEAALRGFPTLHDVERIMVLQGCRPEEVMAIEQANVDLKKGEFRITKGKSAAARRTLAMVPEAAEILAKRLRIPNRWVFPSPRYPDRHITKVNNPHNRVCELTEMDIVPYDMRHTFGTRYAVRGCPLPLLASIMGHGNLRSVMRYIHPSQENISAALLYFASDPVQERSRRSTRRSTFGPPSTPKKEAIEQMWTRMVHR